MSACVSARGRGLLSGWHDDGAVACDCPRRSMHGGETAAVCMGGAEQARSGGAVGTCGRAVCCVWHMDHTSHAGPARCWMCNNVLQTTRRRTSLHRRASVPLSVR